MPRIGFVRRGNRSWSAVHTRFIAFGGAQSIRAWAQKPSVKPTAAPTMVYRAMLSTESPSDPKANPQTPKTQSKRLDRESP